MKILVTGAAGFIGSHLCERLALKGHRVIAVDDFSTGRLTNLVQARKNGKVDVIRLDLRDFEKTAKLFANIKPGAIYHLAAYSKVGGKAQRSREIISRNVIATSSALEAARKSGCKLFVFASTSAVYGIKKGRIKEDAKHAPISLYGKTKSICERLCLEAAGSMRCVIFRLPNIVGKRMDKGVIFDLCRQLRKNVRIMKVRGDGRQKKQFMLVEDAIGAMVFGAKNCANKACAYNVCGKTSTSVSTVAKMICREMKANPKIVYMPRHPDLENDVPRYELDGSKLRRLGWKPKHESDSAVLLAVKELLSLN